MANLSEDIQCAGFDTRPPMLDRTDFVSWQQRIRLYYRGKENAVNILNDLTFLAGSELKLASYSKSPSVLKELLASSILNVEAGVEVVATLPLVTSLVSATPKCESGAPIDSIIGLNLRTIGTSERFVISSNSSHHSSTNTAGAEGDTIIRSAVVPPMMTEAMVTSHAVNPPSVPVHALETTCSSLRDQVLGYERLKEQIEKFQDAQMNIVNDKVAKLDA
nr:integrase, catalytic region, zinc finger, CCHC-type, peptidase aspartic, catalytic [Tanacetum cinerariifolium]